MRWMTTRPIIVALAALLAAAPGAAEIYKTVDENGNVVYTDQKPAPDAVPYQPEPLNIAEAHRPLPVAEPPADNGGDRWAGFAIVSPAPDENIWGTGNTLNVRLQSPAPLRSGMVVQLYLDGQPRGPAVPGLSASLPEIDRGTHALYAELIDEHGAVVARSAAVTFHMKQMARNLPGFEDRNAANRETNRTVDKNVNKNINKNVNKNVNRSGG